MTRIHEYPGKDITVTYDAKRCIHAAECVRGLGKVFDPDNRPWIDPDEATADEVAEVIGRCPTGALEFVRHDGGGAVAASGDTATAVEGDAAGCATIDVAANGPLLIAGDISLGLSTGGSPVKATRMALCRCGHSSNKPYCDGSHANAGFVAD